MSAFYLTPTAISDLALLIFAGFITGYLVYLTWYTRAKRPYQIIFLTLAFVSVSGYILLDFLNQTLYPDLAFWFLPLQSVDHPGHGLAGAICLLPARTVPATAARKPHRPWPDFAAALVGNRVCHTLLRQPDGRLRRLPPRQC